MNNKTKQQQNLCYMTVTLKPMVEVGILVKVSALPCLPQNIICF